MTHSNILSCRVGTYSFFPRDEVESANPYYQMVDNGEVILQGEEVWKVLNPEGRFRDFIWNQRYWICQGNDGYWYKSKTAGPHHWERLIECEVQAIQSILSVTNPLIEA